MALQKIADYQEVSRRQEVIADCSVVVLLSKKCGQICPSEESFEVFVG
jgi:hypothetical protein